MAEPDWDKIREFLEPESPKYCPQEPTLKQKAFLRCDSLEALYGGKAGGGKGFSVLNGLVATPFGFRKASDLKVGDRVSNPDGSIATIIKIHPLGQRQLYRVSFADGASTEVTEDHLWLTKIAGKQKKGLNRNFDKNHGWETEPTELRVTTTLALKEYLEIANEKLASGERPFWPLIPLTQPVQFTPPKGRWGDAKTIDPYVLGVLLGDGHLPEATFSLADDEIVDRVRDSLPEGRTLSKYESPGLADTYRIIPGGKDFKNLLEKLGLADCKSRDKFVPSAYKVSSLDTRWALIQGLMDTDGYVDSRGHCSYVSISKQLAQDVQWIVRSLGFKATITTKIPTYKYLGKKKEGQLAYTVTIQGPNSKQLFHLTRKKERCVDVFNGGASEYMRRMVSIKETTVETAMCITVDNPNGLYITDDFIVTHNSSALLMAALQYVHIPGYAAMIFRNTFSDLSLPGALMERAHDWLDGHPDLHWSEANHRWTFPSGATVTFGYLDKPNSHLRYKSSELQFIGFDEVTEISEKHYRYLFSRLRRPSGFRGAALAKVPLRVRAASNPAPNWVRRRFIEEGKQNGIVYIPAGLSDNPYVDAEAYLFALEKVDPVERARLKEGDWYAEEEGSKFSKDWFVEIAPEDVPREVQWWRGWDMAATLPSERNPDPDWTAGAKVGIHEGKMYIAHIERFRLDSDGVEKRVRQIADDDGVEVKVRMEQEGGASGKMMIDHYSRFVLLGYDFDGHPTNKNKETRADPWAAKAKRGEVYIVRDGTWRSAFLDETGGFLAGGTHDDQIDAVSCAFECITGLGQKQRRPVEIIV